MTLVQTTPGRREWGMFCQEVVNYSNNKESYFFTCKYVCQSIHAKLDLYPDVHRSVGVRLSFHKVSESKLRERLMKADA
jgi:hypothetical protein